MTLKWNQVAGQLKSLISLALQEDIGRGDVTGQLIPLSHKSSYALRARESGVFSGSFVAKEVFRQMNLLVSIKDVCPDGKPFAAGDVLQVYEGPFQITSAERTLLNIVQHLTAISTETSKWVREIKNTKCQLYDTRKTTPGWRFLEKLAVRQGGGCNHRIGLFDAVMIKDNHLAHLNVTGNNNLTEFVSDIVKRARPLPVIVEVENLDQCLAVASAQPQVILLDNMNLDELRTCVDEVHSLSLKKRPQLEASGGITRDNVRDVALTGVDRVSVGALTQNPPRIDLGLDVL